MVDPVSAALEDSERLKQLAADAAARLADGNAAPAREGPLQQASLADAEAPRQPGSAVQAAARPTEAAAAFGGQGKVPKQLVRNTVSSVVLYHWGSEQHSEGCYHWHCRSGDIIVVVCVSQNPLVRC